MNICRKGRKFYCSFSKKLYYLFCSYRGGIARAIRKELQKKQLRKSPIEVSFRPTNVHLSLTTLLPFRECLTTLIPFLEKKFGIENSQAEEETNINTPLSWKTILENVNLFRTVSIRLKNPSVHIKFQPSKKKDSTHCSLILPGFSLAGTRLVEQIEQLCGDVV